jgi:hypothetical protein
MTLPTLGQKIYVREVGTGRGLRALVDSLAWKLDGFELRFRPPFANDNGLPWPDGRSLSDQEIPLERWEQIRNAFTPEAE